MDAPASDFGALRVHHASHLPLVIRVGSLPHRGRRPLDAVIVPASRSVDHLSAAFALAEGTGCVVLALCNGVADPTAAVIAAEGRRPPVRLYAIDARWTPGSFSFLPGAVATVHWAAEGQRTVARCRDIGVLVARLAGWQRILFLDDDITGLDHRDLLRAVDWLGPGREAVGWVARTFPDNSVVCHANRLAGNPQDCFVGSEALALAIHERTPFFPPLYNEDWLFLYDLLVSPA